MSRPAVSQHLRVLREARLVSERAEGSRRIYRLELDGVGALQAYLDRVLELRAHSVQTTGREASGGGSMTAQMAETRQSGAHAVHSEIEVEASPERALEVFTVRRD